MVKPPRQAVSEWRERNQQKPRTNNPLTKNPSTSRLGRKLGAELGGEAGGFSSADINRHPERARLSEKLFVDLTADFGEAFELQPTGLADPRAQDNLLPERSRKSVIDLVPQHDPADGGLRLRARERFPMRGRNILDPAQINGVVHVLLLVDVGR